MPELEDMGAQEQGEREKHPSTYREFMEKIGYKYQFAKPRQWLEHDTPFPMNPSFKPPPPISDYAKDVMFSKFIADPMINNPRKLSQRYGVSLKRVDAILRLKGMERHWTKTDKPLQTGFQIGMDRLLGAYTHPAIASETSGNVLPGRPEERSDVTEADSLEYIERRDAVRYRYERQYWESTPEDGREPLLPGVLEAAKQRAHMKEAAEKEMANRILSKRLPKSPWITRPAHHSFVTWRKGRVATRFVDVGAEFLDADAVLKHRAAAKSKHRRRRSQESKHALKN
ncbi:eukaryotic mitochondrial regulator protein-domain-containing protein [Gymnopilus junonius]|uniref:Eukaryotic mitochondrial regulator protein-domain-containing protein n=1 Tax=Gymnopilus junonius TaxID=109634 RepID=A0A9P5P2P4_GYMJU|nr:eukaryotic mitochondrial regulator protein-domain-containing protein [Gymnopilus junonius]